MRRNTGRAEAEHRNIEGNMGEPLGNTRGLAACSPPTTKNIRDFGGVRGAGCLGAVGATRQTGQPWDGGNSGEQAGVIMGRTHGRKQKVTVNIPM